MSDDKQNPDNNFAMIGGGILAGMIVLGLLLLVAQPASGSFLWQWLATETLSPSETMRNYGLIAAGFIGLILAYWRAHTADRDNRIAQEAHRREISKIDQERFQTGAVALGSESMTVRIAAISSLANLATEQRSSFYHQTVELLEAFARDRSALMREKNAADQLHGSKNDLPSPEDITHAVKTLLRIRSSKNPTKLNLYDLYLCRSTFSEITFYNCDIKRSNFSESTLTNSIFNRSILHKTNFSRCDLTNTHFLKTELLFTNFSQCRSLYCSFYTCILHNVIFDLSYLFYTKFFECEFKKVNISSAKFARNEFSPTPETGFIAWADMRPIDLPLDTNSTGLFKPTNETDRGDLWLIELLSEMSWADAEAEYPQKGSSTSNNRD